MISVNANHSAGDPTTSLTLLARVKNNDQQAWSKFATLYVPLIRLWCRPAQLRAHDLDEVVQEVLRTVATSIQKMRHEEATDTLRGWLRTITQHKLAEYFRRRERDQQGLGGSDAQRLFQQTPAPELGDEADLAERLLLLHQAINDVLKGCEEQTRQIFWKLVGDGQAPRAVAEELGVGIQVVYLARSRTLKKLRQEYVGLIDLDAPWEKPND